jgi:hypothetical protein
VLRQIGVVPSLGVAGAKAISATTISQVSRRSSIHTLRSSPTSLMQCIPVAVENAIDKIEILDPMHIVLLDIDDAISIE